jgi:hypothetical protein
VSLSNEPAYSELKNHFVCGYRDISDEKYAGNSGTHKMNGNAVDTTNGAGPHNLQLFCMNPDGTVLHCLPGYWNPKDLALELQFAEKLNDVYSNGSLTAQEKADAFKRMQLDHVRAHPQDMVARSQMQHFDQKFEATHRLLTSDTIKDRVLAGSGEWDKNVTENAFKTTDEIMHQRMASRPFEPYTAFDTARFVDYGTTTYDKHEDSLDADGHMAEGPAKMEWIKNGGNHRHATRSPSLEIRTYGSLRKSALPQPANNQQISAR